MTAPHTYTDAEVAAAFAAIKEWQESRSRAVSGQIMTPQQWDDLASAERTLARVVCK